MVSSIFSLLMAGTSHDGENDPDGTLGDGNHGSEPTTEAQEDSLTADETRRRLERATAAVEYDDAETRRDTELGVQAAAFADVYPVSVENEITAQHARNLSNLRNKPMDETRANRVASVARKHAAADVPPSAYVATYMSALEAVTDDAFASLEAGEDPAAVREQLLAALRAAMVDVQVGVDEFSNVDTVAPLADDEYIPEMTMAEVFDAVPHAVFLIDDQNTVLEYNGGV